MKHQKHRAPRTQNTSMQVCDDLMFELRVKTEVTLLNTAGEAGRQGRAGRAAAPATCGGPGQKWRRGGRGQAQPAARGQPRVCRPRPAGTGLAGSWGGAWASAATRHVAGREKNNKMAAPRAGLSGHPWDRRAAIAGQGARNRGVQSGTCFAAPLSSLGGHSVVPGPRNRQPRVAGGPSALADRDPGARAPPRVPLRVCAKPPAKLIEPLGFRPYVCCALLTRLTWAFPR